MTDTTIAGLDPAGRLGALADAGTLALDPPAGASPHLARFGIAAREDDGVVTGRATIGGRRVLVAAQDERFLRGAAGERHARALEALFANAREERPDAVVLVMASGGVRLHEANAAELALARALSASSTRGPRASRCSRSARATCSAGHRCSRAPATGSRCCPRCASGSRGPA